MTAIRALHKEYVGVSPTGKEPKNLGPITLAQDTIRGLAHSLKLPHPEKIFVEPHGLAYEWNKAKGKWDLALEHLEIQAGGLALGPKHLVGLSALFLLDDQQIPKEIQIKTGNVPNALGTLAKNYETCQKFGKWACEHLKMPRTKKDRDLIDEKNLEIYLELIKNPTQAKDVLRFIIGHELGHIYYHDTRNKFLLLAAAVVTVIASSIFGGIAAGAATLFALNLFWSCFKKYYGVQKELRADIFASPDEKAALAGIYFLETYNKVAGFDVGTDSSAHPGHSQRIAALKKHLEKLKASRHPRLYRNNLKDRESGKECPQNLHLERATIARRQGASENANFEANTTPLETDFSSCFGITATPIRV